MSQIRVYQVGGSVRDSILGLKSKDLDYSVEAPSFAAMRDYIAARGKIFLEQEQYLTIRAHMQDGEPADYVLCRKDGTYTDGRRPDTVVIGTLADDLARRDFTMNSIAIDESGNYIDPYDGITDINNKLIRCVGSPERRFTEDGLRIIRALRFSITKRFDLHESIVEFLKDTLNSLLLVGVSEERINDELYRCFAANTLDTLRILEEFPAIRHRIFGYGNRIWLKPTLEKP